MGRKLSEKNFKALKTAWEMLVDEKRRSVTIEMVETMKNASHKGFSYEELRIASDIAFDAKNWKNPFRCMVNARLVALFMAATEFFHGNTPEVFGPEYLTGLVRVSGRGYTCD